MEPKDINEIVDGFLKKLEELGKDLPLGSYEKSTIMLRGHDIAGLLKRSITARREYDKYHDQAAMAGALGKAKECRENLDKMMLAVRDLYACLSFAADITECDMFHCECGSPINWVDLGKGPESREINGTCRKCGTKYSNLRGGEGITKNG